MAEPDSTNSQLRASIEAFVGEHPIDAKVAEQLGRYVYGLYSPGSDVPIYVGKGTDGRVLAHFSEALSDIRDTKKLNALRNLFAQHQQPAIRILRRQIDSEQAAYEIEAALIDALVPEGNRVLGHGAYERGSRDLRDLISLYSAVPLKEAEIIHPMLMIKVDRRWREEGLSRDFDPEKLYVITRRAWKINIARAAHHLACAVAEGIIREVYTVDGWHPDSKEPGRFEFSGSPSAMEEHRRYVDRSVRSLFKPGSQSPVTYWPRAAHG